MQLERVRVYGKTEGAVTGDALAKRTSRRETPWGGSVPAVHLITGSAPPPGAGTACAASMAAKKRSCLRDPPDPEQNPNASLADAALSSPR
jgi:hypothetical protein